MSKLFSSLSRSGKGSKSDLVSTEESGPPSPSARPKSSFFGRRKSTFEAQADVSQPHTEPQRAPSLDESSNWVDEWDDGPVDGYASDAASDAAAHHAQNYEGESGEAGANNEDDEEVYDIPQALSSSGRSLSAALQNARQAPPAAPTNSQPTDGDTYEMPASKPITRPMSVSKPPIRPVSVASPPVSVASPPVRASGVAHQSSLTRGDSNADDDDGDLYHMPQATQQQQNSSSMPRPRIPSAIIAAPVPTEDAEEDDEVYDIPQAKPQRAVNPARLSAAYPSISAPEPPASASASASVGVNASTGRPPSVKMAPLPLPPSQASPQSATVARPNSIAYPKIPSPQVPSHARPQSISYPKIPAPVPPVDATSAALSSPSPGYGSPLAPMLPSMQQMRKRSSETISLTSSPYQTQSSQPAYEEEVYDIPQPLAAGRRASDEPKPGVKKGSTGAAISEADVAAVLSKIPANAVADRISDMYATPDDVAVALAHLRDGPNERVSEKYAIPDDAAAAALAALPSGPTDRVSDLYATPEDVAFALSRLPDGPAERVSERYAIPEDAAAAALRTLPSGPSVRVSDTYAVPEDVAAAALAALPQGMNDRVSDVYVLPDTLASTNLPRRPSDQGRIGVIVETASPVGYISVTTVSHAGGTGTDDDGSVQSPYAIVRHPSVDADSSVERNPSKEYVATLLRKMSTENDSLPAALPANDSAPSVRTNSLTLPDPNDDAVRVRRTSSLTEPVPEERRGSYEQQQPSPQQQQPPLSPREDSPHIRERTTRLTKQSAIPVSAVRRESNTAAASSQAQVLSTTTLSQPQTQPAAAVPVTPEHHVTAAPVHKKKPMVPLPSSSGTPVSTSASTPTIAPPPSSTQSSKIPVRKERSESNPAQPAGLSPRGRSESLSGETTSTERRASNSSSDTQSNVARPVTGVSVVPRRPTIEGGRPLTAKQAANALAAPKRPGSRPPIRPKPAHLAPQRKSVHVDSDAYDDDATVERVDASPTESLDSSTVAAYEHDVAVVDPSVGTISHVSARGTEVVSSSYNESVPTEVPVVTSDSSEVAFVTLESSNAADENGTVVATDSRVVEADSAVDADVHIEEPAPLEETEDAHIEPEEPPHVHIEKPTVPEGTAAEPAEDHTEPKWTADAHVESEDAAGIQIEESAAPEWSADAHIEPEETAGVHIVEPAAVTTFDDGPEEVVCDYYTTSFDATPTQNDSTMKEAADSSAIGSLASDAHVESSSDCQQPTVTTDEDDAQEPSRAAIAEPVPSKSFSAEDSSASVDGAGRIEESVNSEALAVSRHTNVCVDATVDVSHEAPTEEQPVDSAVDTADISGHGDTKTAVGAVASPVAQMTHTDADVTNNMRHSYVPTASRPASQSEPSRVVITWTPAGVSQAVGDGVFALPTKSANAVRPLRPNSRSKPVSQSAIPGEQPHPVAASVVPAAADSLSLGDKDGQRTADASQRPPTVDVTLATRVTDAQSTHSELKVPTAESDSIARTTLSAGGAVSRPPSGVMRAFTVAPPAAPASKEMAEDGRPASTVGRPPGKLDSRFFVPGAVLPVPIAPPVAPVAPIAPTAPTAPAIVTPAATNISHRPPSMTPTTVTSVAIGVAHPAAPAIPTQASSVPSQQMQTAETDANDDDEFDETANEPLVAEEESEEEVAATAADVSPAHMRSPLLQALKNAGAPPPVPTSPRGGSTPQTAHTLQPGNAHSASNPPPLPASSAPRESSFVEASVPSSRPHTIVGIDSGAVLASADASAPGGSPSATRSYPAGIATKDKDKRSSAIPLSFKKLFKGSDSKHKNTVADLLARSPTVVSVVVGRQVYRPSDSDHLMFDFNETLTIMNIGPECPRGTWLATNAKGQAGFVPSALVAMDADAVRKRMMEEAKRTKELQNAAAAAAVTAAAASVTAPIADEDEEEEDDNYASIKHAGRPTFAEEPEFEEEIYDDIGEAAVVEDADEDPIYESAD